MSMNRRAALSVLGVTLPWGLVRAAPLITGSRQARLHYRSFESSVREAFRDCSPQETPACRRIEVGYTDLLQTVAIGCQNAKPFAGFPIGQLCITRCGSEPGSAVGGVRLFVTWVEVLLVRNSGGQPSCVFDFARLPPAPLLTAVA